MRPLYLKIVKLTTLEVVLLNIMAIQTKTIVLIPLFPAFQRAKNELLRGTITEIGGGKPMGTTL